jgi:predicted ATPase
MERLWRLPYHARFPLLHKLRDLAADVLRILTEDQPKKYSGRLATLPGQTLDAVTYMEKYFTSAVRYLGPLRDEPKALYPLAASADPLDVGLRGEYTAAVLDRHKTVRISYVPTSHFSKTGVNPSTLTRTLQTAVHDWLQYMGVAQAIVTRDLGKLGHELKVSTIGVQHSHDLTHVGVGVSQILPIVVMALLAEGDSTLVFEQPELHLHPRVQTLLGDFFLSVALTRKQCVVETHSEYLINRLRLRAASAPGETISSLATIYFVEHHDNYSTYRPVVVNKYGAILDWPEGFFDQSQREAEDILMAALLKKKQRKEEREEGGIGHAQPTA